MSNQTSITAIQQEEKSAEAKIEQAKEKAKEKINKIDEEMRIRFFELKETLSNEKMAIAEKVQNEAQEFKNEAAAKLKSDLKTIESGAQERINKAVKQVIKDFSDYVSE